MLRSLVSLAIIMAFAFGSSAQAESLKPLQAGTVDLVTMKGTAYFTVEPDGHHVVVTMADFTSRRPIRMTAVLGDDQRVVLSAPCPDPEMTGNAIELRRQGDRVIINSIDLAGQPIKQVAAVTK